MFLICPTGDINEEKQKQAQTLNVEREEENAEDGGDDNSQEKEADAFQHVKQAKKDDLQVSEPILLTKLLGNASLCFRYQKSYCLIFVKTYLVLIKCMSKFIFKVIEIQT